MTRRMACSLTMDAVRARTKTVTRRDPATWKTLVPGDRLTLIEKGMGLKKGEKQVVLAEVEIVDVRIEDLNKIATETGGFQAALDREGCGHMTLLGFAVMWLASHGQSDMIRLMPGGVYVEPDGWRTSVRRIEWRYVEWTKPGAA